MQGGGDLTVLLREAVKCFHARDKIANRQGSARLNQEATTTPTEFGGDSRPKISMQARRCILHMVQFVLITVRGQDAPMLGGVWHTKIDSLRLAGARLQNELARHETLAAPLSNLTDIGMSCVDAHSEAHLRDQSFTLAPWH